MSVVQSINTAQKGALPLKPLVSRSILSKQGNFLKKIHSFYPLTRTPCKESIKDLTAHDDMEGLGIILDAAFTLYKECYATFLSYFKIYSNLILTKSTPATEAYSNIHCSNEFVNLYHATSEFFNYLNAIYQRLNHELKHSKDNSSSHSLTQKLNEALNYLEQSLASLSDESIKLPQYSTPLFSMGHYLSCLSSHYEQTYKSSYDIGFFGPGQLNYRILTRYHCRTEEITFIEQTNSQWQCTDQIRLCIIHLMYQKIISGENCPNSKLAFLCQQVIEHAPLKMRTNHLQYINELIMENGQKHNFSLTLPSSLHDFLSQESNKQQSIVP